jgi:iron-sulfur cluster repair protein YtfE (RIC family)
MNITKDTKVSDIIAANPGAVKVFKRHGFFALMARLQKPGAKDDTTLASACAQQGADVGKIIQELQSVCQTPQPAAADTGEIMINKKMKTSEVTNRYPAAKTVFTKYFGAGCFTCPAFGTEDVAFACLMHNTNVDQFVKECIEAVKKGREAKKVASS